MTGATACWEDSAAVDLINLVQAQAVKAGLAGTADADTPVLTLLGIRFTGAQVKAYLETSATYFQQVAGAGPLARMAMCPWRIRTHS